MLSLNSRDSTTAEMGSLTASFFMNHVRHFDHMHTYTTCITENLSEHSQHSHILLIYTNICHILVIKLHFEESRCPTIQRFR